jgi:hypothetical protein
LVVRASISFATMTTTPITRPDAAGAPWDGHRNRAAPRQPGAMAPSPLRVEIFQRRTPALRPTVLAGSTSRSASAESVQSVNPDEVELTGLA